MEIKRRKIRFLPDFSLLVLGDDGRWYSVGSNFGEYRVINA